MTCTGAGPQAKAQPLRFSNVVGTDPSTDVVLVLNHEAVVGELARACDIYDDEAPDIHMIIIKELMEEGKAGSDGCKKDTCRGDGPTRLGDMQPEGRPN